MGKKLYVGNLSYSVTSSDLEQLFGQHGQVTSAQVINDRDTGRSKGFGFVEMSSDDEATAATMQPFSDAIPDVRWEVFAESSHMPHVEEEERFLEVVGAFLRDHD